ncbi:hypothetical protein SprV_0401455000 [Sparganum proliferum]
MALPEAKLFEDEFPLVRSCPTLNEIRIAEEIKDLTIEVKDGALLHAHRIILAARIPSLRASLSGPCGEDIPVLKWPSVPLSLATSLVHYAYTGQVELTQSNMKGIISLARLFKLPVLENWAAQFMANTVNSENLATTWDFARSLNVRLLLEACVHQMRESFESFIYCDLFVRLPADTVLTLLRSDNLPVNSEEQVFGAISRWVYGSKVVDEDRLKMHAPTMLKEVQWHQTTVEFRQSILERHPMFTDGPGCGRLMALVEQWVGAADRDKRTCPFNQNGRGVRPPQAFFVFGEGQSQGKWSVLRLDSNLQEEERVADMEMRWGASYTVVGECIFIVGGETAEEVGSTRVDEFLVRERRWRSRSPLALRRRDHAAAVVRVNVEDEDSGENALIGVFGGSFKEGETWTNLACCEVYDINQDRWHKLPDLREKRGAPTAVSLPGDNRVFVFGGRDCSSMSATVEFCHLQADWQEKAISATTANFWLPAAPMRHARAYLAAAHFRGRIIAAGGLDGEYDVNFVEVFSLPDTATPLGQWTELASMNKPRSAFCLLTSADTVFALGEDEDPGNTVETFAAPEGSVDFGNDLTSWMWSSRSPLRSVTDIVEATLVLWQPQ